MDGNYGCCAGRIGLALMVGDIIVFGLWGMSQLGQTRTKYQIVIANQQGYAELRGFES